MSAAYILIPPSLSRGKIASTSAIFVWPQQAESNFHEAKASPVHENLRTLFQRQRLPGRRQRGGRGPTGENKKSRLAIRRARDYFLVAARGILVRLRGLEPPWSCLH